VERDLAGFSSGVIVHPRGLVLSDGDAGLVWTREAGRSGKSWSDDVEVRLVGIPGARPLRARVVARDRDIDVSLLEIRPPPAEPLPYVPLGRSEALRVGQIVLALGTTFDERGVTPPTLTAGLVSAFTWTGPGAAGSYRSILTSAAVNQGVNGGPLIDLAGRLVGTISTYLDPEPDEPHPYLGKAVPIDLVRTTLGARPEMAEVLAAGEPDALPDDGPARALERTFHAAGLAAWPAVVSLEIERRHPVRRETLLEDEVVSLPRWTGPVTGIVADREGHIVTSLYNVTNVGDRARPTWNAPTGAGWEAGLADIEGAVVHDGSGQRIAAAFTGVDLRLGIAVFTVADDVAALPPPLVPAPEPAARRGRFVLALGNPYGAQRPPQPLLTMGILSKLHAQTAPSAWRGQWQTDAAGLDTNAGGPVVDVEGRVLGMLTLWHPARHGRGSGVAFVIPWPAIAEAIPRVAAGRGPRLGILGVYFGAGSRPVVSRTVPDGAAARAGLRAGDRLLQLDGNEVPTTTEARNVLLNRYEGEAVRVRVQRGAATIDLDVELAARDD
jgi:S1-C subfamily serine protease